MIKQYFQNLVFECLEFLRILKRQHLKYFKKSKTGETGAKLPQSKLKFLISQTQFSYCVF